MIPAMSRAVWITVGAIILGLILGCAVGGKFRRPSSQGQSIPSSTLATQASSTNGAETYTNSEYGFDFLYPQDWTTRENSFKSYYSRFNVEIVPPTQTDLFDPILVNVVLPEFPDRTFRGLGATTSTVVVDGIPGTKYEYEFEGTPEIDIVLPLGEYKMIIGTKKKYEGVYRQIVDSFHFLR
jgi:hypothetical protein